MRRCCALREEAPTQRKLKLATQGFGPEQFETLMIMRNCQRQINHCQQHEHISLNEGYAKVKPQKYKRNSNR